MTKKKTVRSYDVWQCMHGVPPVVAAVVEAENIDVAYQVAVAKAQIWYPSATLSKGGRGAPAMLVKDGGKVIGTVAVEPTSRRPDWVRVEIRDAD